VDVFAGLASLCFYLLPEVKSTSKRHLFEANFCLWRRLTFQKMPLNPFLSKIFPSKAKRTYSCGFLFVALVVVVAIAVGLGVGLGKRERASTPSTGQQSGSATATATATPSSYHNSTTWWKPKSRTTWQIILNETVGTSNFDDVSVYDIDLFDSSNQTINALHAAGIKVICYFSAGSYENWRPDANQFPSSVMGNDLDGWPGERWLNISSSVVRNIMVQRIELAYQKSCDGLDPDNIDGYDNDNGLGLTEKDSINYVQFLANEGHSRGMAVGLKNGAEIVVNVRDNVDWEVNEQCVQYNECDSFEPFIAANKPVFHIEYPNNTNIATAETICEHSPSNFSTLLKDMNLDGWYEACWNLPST
jgi:endo-alpha-1,4-polygalactosaminidase (GH114 family)